jgi:hypothetical protein
VRAKDSAGAWGPADHLLVVVNGDPSVSATDVNRPLVFSLDQNMPNPFRPSTTIRYALAQAGEVELVIYNVAGARVRTLVSGQQPAGRRYAIWDGRDEAGRRVGDGVYFYSLRSGKLEASRKMLLLK